MNHNHKAGWLLLSSSLSPAVTTTAWLLRIMLPVSLAVTILQYYGVVDTISHILDPAFHFIGLPGRASVAFVTAASVTTYAGIAVMTSLDLTIREASILSAMALLCHALPMESAVVGKVGSRPLLMAAIRIVAAFTAAFVLNMLLPEMSGHLMPSPAAPLPPTSLSGVLVRWLLTSVRLGCMIFLIIYLLMVIQRVLDRYNALPWLVGNVLGISYGAAVMTEMMRTGRISRHEADEANYHLIMNHSMIEDTLVYAALGIPPALILSVRIVFALIVVWTRKFVVCVLRRG